MFQPLVGPAAILGLFGRSGLRLAEFASNSSNGMAYDIMCYSSFFEHLLALLSYVVLVCNMLKPQDLVISSSFDLTLPPCLY
jgi:hypothetical protein